LETVAKKLLISPSQLMEQAPTKDEDYAIGYVDDETLLTQDLDISLLQEVSGLEIVWTDSMDQYLRLDHSHMEKDIIYVFWFTHLDG
jgi:hypothetical protein